jgi:hypothetical protein
VRDAEGIDYLETTFVESFLRYQFWGDALKNALGQLEKVIAKDPSVAKLVSPRIARWLFGQRVRDSREKRYITGDFLTLGKAGQKDMKAILNEMIGFTGETLTSMGTGKKDRNLAVAENLLNYVRSASKNADTQQATFMAASLESAVVGLTSMNELGQMLTYLASKGTGAENTEAFKNPGRTSLPIGTRRIRDPSYAVSHPSVLADIGINRYGVYTPTMALLENATGDGRWSLMRRRRLLTNLSEMAHQGNERRCT